MWQKCPVCNGTGQVPHSFNGTVKCHVCDGKGIIDSITGAPPKKDSGDFRDDQNYESQDEYFGRK